MRMRQALLQTWHNLSSMLVVDPSLLILLQVLDPLGHPFLSYSLTSALVGIGPLPFQCLLCTLYIFEHQSRSVGFSWVGRYFLRRNTTTRRS